MMSIRDSCIITSSIDPILFFENIDCASQLQNGVVLTFQYDTHMSSRVMYANTSLLILLHLMPQLSEVLALI